MSKPYEANSIYDLKQLTIKQGSMPFFFLSRKHRSVAIRALLGGADKARKHFNGLLSLRWEHVSKNWYLLSLVSW